VELAVTAAVDHDETSDILVQQIILVLFINQRKPNHFTLSSVCEIAVTKKIMIYDESGEHCLHIGSTGWSCMYVFCN
jgi:hypothetical protein